MSTPLTPYKGAVNVATYDAFKAEGLSGRVSQSQVLKANPGLDANRLLVGQKLLIPLPGEQAILIKTLIKTRTVPLHSKSLLRFAPVRRGVSSQAGRLLLWSDSDLQTIKHQT